MSQILTQTEIIEQIKTISESMQSAKQNKDIALYNSLVKEYDSLIFQLESEDPTEIDAGSDTIESNKKVEDKHTGIMNILKGIVNNTKKGKYSERDKTFIIRELKFCIDALEDIDADIAQSEKQKRVKTFSSFNERL